MTLSKLTSYIIHGNTNDGLIAVEHRAHWQSSCSRDSNVWIHYDINTQTRD